VAEEDIRIQEPLGHGLAFVAPGIGGPLLLGGLRFGRCRCGKPVVADDPGGACQDAA
jgi:hypothetical protein